MPKRVAVKGKRAAPPKVRRKVYNNDPEPESSGSDGGGSVLFDDDDDLIDLSMAHDAQHDDDDDNDNDFGSQVSVGAFDFDERLPSPPPTQREPARQQQRGRVQQLHRAVEEEHARVCARGARKLRRTREPVERNDGNKSRAQGRKYAAQPRGRYGQPREGSEGDEEAWYSDDLGLVPDNHPHAHDYSVPERDVGSRAQVGARRGASKGRGRSKGQSNAAEAAVGVDEQKLDELDPVRNVRQVIQRRPVHLPDNNANSAGCAQMMNDLIKRFNTCKRSIGAAVAKAASLEAKAGAMNVLEGQEAGELRKELQAIAKAVQASLSSHDAFQKQKGQAEEAHTKELNGEVARFTASFAKSSKATINKK